MIVCKKCGRSNEDHYRFCLGCGSRLASQKPPVPVEPSTQNAARVSSTNIKIPDRICTNCRSVVPESFTFCGKCGTRYVIPISSISSDGPTLARLVTIKPDGSEGENYEMTEGVHNIGRQGPKPFEADPFLSPAHARFNVSDESEVVVEDMGSLNGIFIRVTEQVELLHGAQIRIGQELLQYQSLDEQEPLIEAADDTLVKGSPETGAWGRLERIVAPGLSSHAYLLDKEEISLGREFGDIIFNDDGFVSGRHAKIAMHEGRTLLDDLGSSNGTYIRLTSRRVLAPGDLLLLGQQVVRFELL